MPSHYDDDFDSSKATTIVKNLYKPLTEYPRGAAVVVAIDTLVEKLIRRYMKDSSSTFDVAMSHVLSVPFRGGLAFLADDSRTDLPVFGNDSSVTGRAMDGVSMAPSVLLGQYILSTSRQGLHTPKFNGRNVLTVIAAQAISQNILPYVRDWLPTEFFNDTFSIQALWDLQKRTGITRTKASGRSSKYTAPKEGGVGL